MVVINFSPEYLQEKLLHPEQLIKKIPLDVDQADFIEKTRQEIVAILSGWDNRKLLIVGPCSIHDIESALEYARRLKALSEHVSDRFLIVMRTYVEKPRTIVGWKGMLYDPEADGSYQIARGLRLTRVLLRELAMMEVPAASELLELNTAPYYVDLLSWGCIGARTSSSPPHRQLAASLSLPVGFKNSCDGHIDSAIHALISAQTPHVFLGLSPSGQMARLAAKGNSNCHLVLRGGYSGPNYYAKNIRESVERCQQAGVIDKLLIDCSHDNCEKRPLKQVSTFQKVMHQIVEGNPHIMGLMLESHLEGGSQPITSNLHYGVSITDPCLDWATTEKLILQAYSKLDNNLLSLVN